MDESKVSGLPRDLGCCKFSSWDKGRKTGITNIVFKIRGLESSTG